MRITLSIEDDLLAKALRASSVNDANTPVREGLKALLELGAISVEVARDPDDAPIRQTLVATHADILVTDDQDLLALRVEYPIETPAEFVRRVYQPQ